MTKGVKRKIESFGLNFHDKNKISVTEENFKSSKKELENFNYFDLLNMNYKSLWANAQLPITLRFRRPNLLVGKMQFLLCQAHDVFCHFLNGGEADVIGVIQIADESKNLKM
jgi:hypothetical protein